MRTDIQHIQALLDRYMEGENTQAELQELKVFFQQTTDLPEELLPYRDMFEVLDKPIVIPSQEALNSFVPVKAKKTMRLWPWVAAACVAGLIAVCLMPPRDNTTVPSGQEVAEVKQDTAQEKPVTINEAPQTVVAQIEEEVPVKTMGQKSVSAPRQQLMAQAVPAEVKAEEVQAVEKKEELAVNIPPVETKQEAKTQPRMLTDRDLPVTRPENYKYTKEELALMRQQANEAYLRWVELELEITRYNMEQTSQR